MQVDGASLDAFRALALGFAFAGLTASAYEAVLRRPVSFRLLQAGGVRAVAAVPVLVFCAPLVILRNTVRGRRIENRPVVAVVVATVIAGLWSIGSGRIVLDAASFLFGA